MKLIIILLILNLILNKKPTGYLYCGLFGWVGSNPSIFNRQAFTLLGLSNEARGGDSCGVYSNKSISYGTGVSKDFPTFIKKIGHVRAGKDCVVMGHTRKASVGGISARNAQPVALKDNDGNLGFILTHNGTLSNHEELAKKYDLDISNLNTDSQILAALMYFSEASLDILGEYNGAAAVVFHMPGTNTIYIFKGKSKNSSNLHYSSEERPLYGYRESNHSFYYSSTKSPLEYLAKDEKDIFDIKCNSLIKITGGKIEEMTDIDRSERYQRYVEPYVYKKPVNVYGYARNNFHNETEDLDNYYRGGYNFDRDRPSAKNGGIEYHNPHKYILSENFATMGDQMVNFSKGRYHLGKHPVHYKVTTNDLGLVIDPEKWTKPYHTLYFWEGILLYGKDQYTDLMNLRKNIKYISPKHMTLLESSPYPVSTYDNDNISKDFRLYTNDDVMFRPDTFSGRFVPIFCNKVYGVREGMLASTTHQSTLNKLTEKNIEFLKTWI